MNSQGSAGAIAASLRQEWTLLPAGTRLPSDRQVAAGTISPPRLLLLDEPVSALDPVNRAAELEMIGGLRDRGIAVLSVFHDLEAIEQLADRVVVIQDGRVAASGAPRQVLRENERQLEVAR